MSPSAGQRTAHFVHYPVVMQYKMIKYVHLKPGADLPDVSRLRPFKAIVVVEESVTPEWQAKVSAWLISSGCLYMMAWGRECSSWDDSVDMANIEAFNCEDIPEISAVMTTWHENESLSEVFWFAKHSAEHPVLPLHNLVIVHVSAAESLRLLTTEYENA